MEVGNRMGIEATRCCVLVAFALVTSGSAWLVLDLKSYPRNNQSNEI